MSDTELSVPSERNTCPYSAASEFEQAVKKAQDLLEKSDLDGALDLLNALEIRYMGSTKLFDLLGDVFLRKGDVEEGIRYKTLYEVLKSTLQSATEHAARRGRDRSDAFDEGAAAEYDAELSEAEFPVTVAMAQEFMRQGQYERAVEVFAKLSRMHPEDKVLQEAEQKAKKKRGEKKLVGILQTWLGNIERMKLDKSGEA